MTTGLNDHRLIKMVFYRMNEFNTSDVAVKIIHKYDRDNSFTANIFLRKL